MDDEEELLVVFRLDDQDYAVDVDAVQEIIRVPEALIRVPRSQSFVEGLVNLRGAVMPVVDLRTRLGLRKDRTDRSRVIVLAAHGTRAGFIVDEVREVARIDRHVPEPNPEFDAVVPRIANLPDQDRVLLLLETAQLLGRAQPVAG
jgi:purine-binding chemotaxis protein CheW